MKHFTMAELTASETARARGLKNAPTAEHRANIEMSVTVLLDPLREAWAINCAHNPGWGTPALNVTSGYRGFALNKAVSGSQTSAHCVGFAFDLVPQNGRLADFKNFCREWLQGRTFDQMISEDENAAGTPRWIHVGYKSPRGEQRRQMLSMRGGKYQLITK